MQSLWMLFASFVFAIMGVCVKLASDLYSISEIIMYRGIIGLIVMLAIVRLRRGDLRTPFAWQHLWRGVIGVIALWMWFFSFSKLPLATAMTLNYMAPIWIAAILFVGGWWRGQQRFEWGLACAIVMSSVGVVLLLRPAIHAEQWLGGVTALLSGMMSALAYLQVRNLGHLGEPEYRVVFYFSLTSVAAGLIGTLLNVPHPLDAVWRVHSMKGILFLLAIGVCATAAQMAMTRAYRLGKVLVTANLQYTGIVFSSLWGIVIWDDVFGWLSWLGIGVILISGVAATFYNTRGVQQIGGAIKSNGAAPDPIAVEI
jgi:S-adenosylmethionine uptake transporter